MHPKKIACLKQALFNVTVFLFSAVSLQAQTASPAIQWAKGFGGSKRDEAYSIQQTSDGGYIAAGLSRSVDGDVTGHHAGGNDETDPYGEDDYWIIKVSNSGSLEWEKSFGGSGDDIAYSIQQTTDGGYIVAGASSSINGDVKGHHDITFFGPDCWIIKLDSKGNIQWQRCLGGSGTDFAQMIKQTSDGGYIIAGSAGSYDGDVVGRTNGFSAGWVVKLSNSGDIQWQQVFNNVGLNSATAIQQTSDQGYIVSAMADNSNDPYYDGWFICKLNSSGEIVWQKFMSDDLEDTPWSIQQTVDGGFIVAGDIYSGIPGVGDSYFIAKLNGYGAIEWTKSFGGDDGASGLWSIQQTIDNGYILVCSSLAVSGVTGNHGYTDYWVAKLDATGNIQWQKSLGGSYVDYGHSVQQTKDGGYIIAGVSFSWNGDVYNNVDGNGNFWIVKLAPPSILTLNPYPSMLKSDGTLNTDVTKIDLNAWVTGAATDGLSKILVVVKSTVPVTFSLSSNKDGTLYSLDGTINNTTSVTAQPVNNLAVAVYASPDGYGTSNKTGGRNISLTATDANNVTSTTQIKLVTPPVVLVHGMWSGPDLAWVTTGFKKYLLQNGIDTVYMPDYEAASAETFDPLDSLSQAARDAIYTKVNQAREDARKQGIVAVQVDAVGHSLGGLQLRSFSQDKRFLDVANYNKGYYHKLITIGTPHLGSEWGPIADNTAYYSAVLAPALPVGVPRYIALSYLAKKVFGGPIGSVQRDFNPAFKNTGKGLDNLTATKLFKVHAIASRWDNWGENNPSNGWAQYVSMLNYIYTNRVELFDKTLTAILRDSTTDLVVPRYSQLGGLTNNKTYSYFANASHSSVPILPGVAKQTASLPIQIEARNLLLSNALDSFATGFPAPNSLITPFSSAKAANNTILPIVSGVDSNSNYVLRIVSPTIANTFKNNGADSITLRLAFTDSSKLASSLFFVQNVGFVAMPAKVPYTAKIALPNTINAGKLAVVALGSDFNGNIYADTLSVTIQGADTLQSITVNPTSVSLDSVTRGASLQVTGLFKKGNDTVYRDISPAQSGTVYSTKHVGSIISVSGDGKVAANSPGVDTITIANNGIAVKIPAKVDSSLLRIVKFANAISLTIPDKAVTDPPFALTGTASSGEDITYKLLSGPVQLQNGIVTIKGQGIVTIQASSPADAYFAAAPTVTRTFVISGSLPVTLINFTGSLDKTDALLKWQTATEENSGYFDIERSTDALHFVSAGVVKAAGNSNVLQNYTFTDANITALSMPEVYYRLKEVDKNGVVNYSKTVVINVSGAAWLIKVVPNPIKDVINIYSSLNVNEANITVRDAAGKVISQTKQNIAAGQQTKIPAARLTAGVYFITIQSSIGSKQFKVVK